MIVVGDASTGQFSGLPLPRRGIIPRPPVRANYDSGLPLTTDVELPRQPYGLTRNPRAYCCEEAQIALRPNEGSSTATRSYLLICGEQVRHGCSQHSGQDHESSDRESTARQSPGQRPRPTEVETMMTNPPFPRPAIVPRPAVHANYMADWLRPCLGRVGLAGEARGSVRHARTSALTSPGW